jgi:serine protease Do
VGVNTAIFTTTSVNSGIGLAIEADTVKQFITAVRNGAIANNSQPSLAAPTVIKLNGNPITATLGTTDTTLPDGSYYKSYQFQGVAGQSVVIEMRGNGIDPYLVLFDSSGRKIAEDDDGGGGKNAKLSLVLPSTGRYTLYANSYEVGETGSFVITGRLSDNFAAESTDSPILLQKIGKLDSKSRIFARDGSLFDTFSFNGQAGQVVQIDLVSPDFHPYLVLFAPNSKFLKENNGLPSRRSASMTIELPVTGTYRTIVNAYDRNGKGAYKLIVKRVR